MKLPVFEPWMADARCAEVDPDLWFPEMGSKASTAKQICETCPVRAACLEYALQHQEYGIWGATSERDRARIRRTRAQEAA